MILKTEEIAQGAHNGKVVWICDLRYSDYGNKPIRHIKPTRVLIRSNSEISRTIYYSNSHFVGLNKNDEPVKSKIYPLFDNTGFRSRTGGALVCCETEEEAFYAYRKLAQTAINGLTEFKNNVISGVNATINDYLSYFTPKKGAKFVYRYDNETDMIIYKLDYDKDDIYPVDTCKVRDESGKVNPKRKELFEKYNINPQEDYNLWVHADNFREFCNYMLNADKELRILKENMKFKMKQGAKGLFY